MGLGLHGGGLASARFFAEQGARVTITDQQDEKALARSLEKLRGFPVRLVLGRHEAKDFSDTDLVIKNPGVPADSPWLKLSREHGVRIETDISCFLAACDNPLVAITGSKGKSTTASAIHAGLSAHNPAAKLGGNITVSPLTFCTSLKPDTPVVLELSSWQLADLAGMNLLKPRVSMITNILPDHMNRYASMTDYINDKRIIYQRQDASDYSIFNLDDPATASFRAESKAHHLFFSNDRLPADLEGGWVEHEKCGIRINGQIYTVLDKPLALPGRHNRLNLLAAVLALIVMGVEPEVVSDSLARFTGIEHRLEFFLEQNGIRFYNDSAATIPHAVNEALRALPGPLILITGGTDKNIDFEPFAETAKSPKNIVLLEGSATDKIISLLNREHISYQGPYPGLETAVREVLRSAKRGDTVLFSPGCASFGMFLNEFDRGKKFKQVVCDLLATGVWCTRQ